MGERYDPPDADSLSASPGGYGGDEKELVELVWPRKAFDELPASETRSGDSPLRELANIRQQIKSMQAARKTRASVLQGTSKGSGDVGS